MKDRLSSSARSAAVLAVLALCVLALAPAAQAGQKLVWEAENYTSIVEPFKVVSKSECSGGKCVFYDNDAAENGAACVNYKLNVPEAAKFTLWARAWWMDGCGDSVFVKVDGGTAEITHASLAALHWFTFTASAEGIAAGIVRRSIAALTFARSPAATSVESRNAIPLICLGSSMMVTPL